MELTERARQRMNWILQNYEGVVRLEVEGGGCAGFTYHFDLGAPEEDDLVVEGVHIDSASLSILRNATIDYVYDLSGAKFHVDIPEAKSSCGCGKSFAVD